jgi:hypothetical protein
MNWKTTGLNMLGSVVYAAGVLIGLLFFGGSVWADFEAFLFAPATGASSNLTGMSCPLLISEHEAGEVVVKIRNASDQPVRRQVRFFNTSGFVTLVDQESQFIEIPANETGLARLTIFPQDAAFGRFILVRAYLFALYPIPAASGACGVIVFSLGELAGSQIVSLAVAFSGLLMALGLALWVNYNRPLQGRRLTLANGMRALTVVIFGGIITSLIGWWIPGALFLLVAFLLTVILITLTLGSPE